MRLRIARSANPVGTGLRNNTPGAARTPASWLEDLTLGETVSFGFLQCLSGALMGGKFLGGPQERPDPGKRFFLPGRKVEGCRVKGRPQRFAGIKRQEGALTEACGNRLREGLDLASGLVSGFHQACCSYQIIA